MTDVATQLLHGLQTIAHRRPRPRPFIDISSLPWDDPVFSGHFLRTATRSQRYTNREIAFLEACGLLRSGKRILDVACGGGRHSLAMARRGVLVTGIDLGPAAIATAKRRAHKAGLAAEFVQGDVRAIEYEAVFDAVTFIFGCFTEMPRHDAKEVLRRISRSLHPGGMLVLDVYAPRFFAALDGEQEWWVGQDFIAGRFPQLVLTEYFYYAREKTYARRDFICDVRTGAIHTFGVSGQAYALPELCGMIEAVGLSPTMVYGSWQREEVTSDSQMYIVLAAKQLSS
jgi:ubiquinone/menaquinone biosynthesis C-methylase UbiE